MPNQVYLVENYILSYFKNDERIRVLFHYKEGTSWRNVTLYPSSDKAVFIADMLRNEKPVYWFPEAGYLTTGGEIVGEQEG